MRRVGLRIRRFLLPGIGNQVLPSGSSGTMKVGGIRPSYAIPKLKRCNSFHDDNDRDGDQTGAKNPIFLSVAPLFSSHLVN